MKLLIDNLDGRGAQDYTAFVDSSKNPSLVRKLNSPAELKFGLVARDGSLAALVISARVVLSLSNGNDLFTGYIVQTPTYQYQGWADRGLIYRYEIVALSDVMLMDQKAPPPHPPFVNRNSGDAFRQLTAEALSARCSYRDDNGKLFFAPLAANTYELAENAETFSPGDLQLQSVNRLVNDLTILGPLEPSAHVKDYFVGDGLTTKFYMSQKPFTRSSQVALYNRTILDETYAELDPTHWAVADPQHVITVG